MSCEERGFSLHTQGILGLDLYHKASLTSRQGSCSSVLLCLSLATGIVQGKGTREG